MIFGTPISWFINEIIAMILFMLCVAHALKQEAPFNKLLELICYMLAAGIFENIGVWQNVYYYSVDRIAMFGKVPVAILLIEGSIFYVAFQLAHRLKLPAWGIPFATGVLCSIQDMTLDPASVYDLHNINGILEGQWNWTKGYEGGFVDIPFANFSGWLTMMLFFSAAVLIGRKIYNRKKRTWIGVAYPICALLVTLIMLVSPVNQFLLYGMPFVDMNTKNVELVLLIVNYAVSLFILLRFAKYNKPFENKEDRLLFFVPTFLHLYAIVSCIALNITKAILPILVVSVLHIGYLCFAYRKCGGKLLTAKRSAV